MPISLGLPATGRPEAVEDDAGKNDGHPDEGQQMRRELRPGCTVVVIDGRARVGDEVGSEAQADDDQANQ
jgi:hypothetical protein